MWRYEKAGIRFFRCLCMMQLHESGFTFRPAKTAHLMLVSLDEEHAMLPCNAGKALPYQLRLRKLVYLGDKELTQGLRVC